MWTIRGVGEGEQLEVLSGPSPVSSLTRSALTYLTLEGLRQAPPQRVLFQPDLSSSRQTRHTPNHTQSPQPLTTSTNSGYTYNTSFNPNSTSFNIANYEPRPQIPLTLRPVLTPGNNPTIFKDRIKKVREAQAARLGKTPPSYKGMMLPGSMLLILISIIPHRSDKT